MDKIKEKIRNREFGRKILFFVGAVFLFGIYILSLQEKDTLRLGQRITPNALEAMWDEEYTLNLPGTTGPINVNTADQEALEALPGVGEKIAKRIVDYREEQGPFHKIEDIVNVSGIGLKKLEQMKKYIVAE